MDAETARRAIEPFFSTKGVGKGTGLGLSMVHGLAAQLGGPMTIQSRRGAGTTVELWLPVAEAKVTESEKAERAVRMATAGTALLVDDEELVRASTADMLSDLGYAVVEAASAEEALRVIDDGLAPDVVIIDHLVLGMTGTDLARALKGRWISSATSPVERSRAAERLKRLTLPFGTWMPLSSTMASPIPTGPDEGARVQLPKHRGVVSHVVHVDCLAAVRMGG